MGKIFMIADTHFADSFILKAEGRPFKNSIEMDKRMVQNWNAVVSEDDTVFHLGDFAKVSDKEYIANIIKQLKGHIILILGNHDTEYKEFYKSFSNIEVVDFPIIYEDFWMLSHKPLYVSMNMPYANVFGHIHNNPMYVTHSARSFCVSVERINYTPIEFCEIKRIVYEDDIK